MTTPTDGVGATIMAIGGTTTTTAARGRAGTAAGMTRTGSGTITETGTTIGNTTTTGTPGDRSPLKASRTELIGTAGNPAVPFPFPHSSVANSAGWPRQWRPARQP